MTEMRTDTSVHFYGLQSYKYYMNAFDKADKLAAEIIIDYYSKPKFNLNLRVLEDTFDDELEVYTEEMRPNAFKKMYDAYEREFFSYFTPRNMQELVDSVSEDELYDLVHDIYGEFDEAFLADLIDDMDMELALALYDPFDGSFDGNAWILAKRELKKDDNSVQVSIREWNGHGKPVKQYTYAE